MDLTQAANLADYPSLYYYDQETGAAIRRWDLMDQGVYSRDATGNVSRYVYSLSLIHILLAEQSYERMLDTEQLAAGWAEGTGHSIHKDVYI